MKIRALILSSLILLIASSAYGADSVIDLSPIMAFFNGFIDIINSVLAWVFEALTKLFWGVLYVVYDGMLTMLQGVVSAIDVSSVVSSLTSSWTGMPSMIIWIITQVGLASAISIVGYAFLIRMTLNLIPGTFTRL